MASPIDFRICCRCKTKKTLDFFGKDSRRKDGIMTRCKDCIKEYTLKTAEKRKVYKREYYSKNWEKVNSKNKKYYLENKEKLFAANTLSRRTNPIVRLKSQIRNRINCAFKRKTWNKSSSSPKILGADMFTVKYHIERQFKKGMYWSNQGLGEGKWVIDHIIPLASAKTEEELIELFHYRNMQPLWWIENAKKSDKILTSQTYLSL